MKKNIIIAVLFTMLFCSQSFAAGGGWAIGGAFTFDWAPANNAYVNGAALVFKLPQLPIMFGVSARFSDPQSAFGATLDWWLQGQLIGQIKIYIGPGAYFWMIFNQQTDNVGFGLRIPVGFQIFIIPSTFEVFLEPAVRIELLPNLPDFGLTAALGLRFWF